MNRFTCALKILGPYAALIATTSLCGPRAFADPTYSVTDLGTFGGYYSQAMKINDHTQVVGAAEQADYDLRAFLWLPEAAYNLPAGLNDLGTLPGGDSSFAWSINNFAEVAGWSYSTTHAYDPFRWIPQYREHHGLSAGMYEIAVLPGDISGIATGINALAEAVGSSYQCGWCPANAWINLVVPNYFLVAGTHPVPKLPLHNQNAAAEVNDLGVVVGISDIVGGLCRAYSWGCK